MLRDSIETVTKSFNAFAIEEISYRSLTIEASEVLNDVIDTAKIIALRDRNRDEPYKSNYNELQRGIRSFNNFIISGSFRPDDAVLPSDVEEWRWNLKTQKLADGTIYNRISALSQFFEYLRKEVGMAKFIPINPARVSLPKANKPFQSESVKALSREELGRLLEVVAVHAGAGQLVLNQFSFYNAF